MLCYHANIRTLSCIIKFLKPEVSLNNIQALKFYHTKITIGLHYKNQIVNVTQRSNRYLFWK
jgi:hypothetical protein